MRGLGLVLLASVLHAAALPLSGDSLTLDDLELELVRADEKGREAISSLDDYETNLGAAQTETVDPITKMQQELRKSEEVQHRAQAIFKAGAGVLSRSNPQVTSDSEVGERRKAQQESEKAFMDDLKSSLDADLKRASRTSQKAATRKVDQKATKTAKAAAHAAPTGVEPPVKTSKKNLAAAQHLKSSAAELDAELLKAAPEYFSEKSSASKPVSVKKPPTAAREKFKVLQKAKPGSLKSPMSKPMKKTIRKSVHQAHNAETAAAHSTSSVVNLAAVSKAPATSKLVAAKKKPASDDASVGKFVDLMHKGMKDAENAAGENAAVVEASAPKSAEEVKVHEGEMKDAANEQKRTAVEAGKSAKKGKEAESHDAPASAHRPINAQKPASAHRPINAQKPASAHKPINAQKPAIAHKPINAQKPGAPASHKPAASASKKPAAPASHKPAAPASKKPAAPASHKPAAPASHKPAAPASHKPAAPASHKPAPTRKPALAAGLKPAYQTLGEVHGVQLAHAMADLEKAKTHVSAAEAAKLTKLMDDVSRVEKKETALRDLQNVEEEVSPSEAAKLSKLLIEVKGQMVKMAATRKKVVPTAVKVTNRATPFSKLAATVVKLREVAEAKSAAQVARAEHDSTLALSRAAAREEDLKARLSRTKEAVKSAATVSKAESAKKVAHDMVGDILNDFDQTVTTKLGEGGRWKPQKQTHGVLPMTLKEPHNVATLGESLRPPTPAEIPSKANVINVSDMLDAFDKEISGRANDH
jgi:hypothetical protein